MSRNVGYTSGWLVVICNEQVPPYDSPPIAQPDGSVSTCKVFFTQVGTSTDR